MVVIAVVEEEDSGATALSITTFSIAIKNGTQHNDIQCLRLVLLMPSVIYAECYK
jgi:hypothetical protein